MSEETSPSARDEIRASEFGRQRCPSCGGLAGDLLGHHNLILLPAGRLPETAECRDGQPVTLTDFDSIRAAMNIALADASWFEEVGNMGGPLVTS